MKESCTRYEGVRESDCLRPVVPCEKCKGRGWVWLNRNYGPPFAVIEPCQSCNGTGGDRCAKHPRGEE